jgi:GTP diphosphokinase / guanosine-3',5'-bis(diphosphate) 3'-diphosphatase
MNVELLDKLEQEYPAYKVEIQKALDFCKNVCNSDQDLDYILTCADLVSTYKLDIHSIVATMLVKTVLINNENLERIKENFDEETFNLVSQISKLSKIDTENKSVEAENIRTMFVALAKDIRVIIIKLAYVVVDLRQKNQNNVGYYSNLYSEAKEIYAPLAGRLGLAKIKVELEDSCLKYYNPQIYKYLENNAELKSKDRLIQIEITKRNLQKILDELNIKGEIMGRQKHFASIYKKMQNKAVTLAQIYDLVAVRIIVQTVDECYTILGKIHTLYKPMNGRFKDYIASPKPNGYQSLHTTVVAENGKPIEIQIRTYEMHQVAEYGVAAHWMYKEHRTQTTDLDQKLGWVRRIMEQDKDLPAEDFVESLKLDLYSGEIFVQTPKGKVVELPEGSTIIDFAYSIHSDVGNRCIGAKVNDKMVPIYSTLSNGDVVEIITSTQLNKGPSRDWLNHTKTNSAKSKINAFFKKEMKEDNIKSGKEMLEQSAKLRGFDLSKIMDEDSIDSTLRRFNFLSVDDMYASIGYGGVSTLQILNRFQAVYSEKNQTSQNTMPKVISNKDDTTKSVILVRGERGILTRFAGCCTPIPGDDIIGFISHGKGITIHRKDCSEIRTAPEERLIEADWGSASDTISFNVNLKIVIASSTGMELLPKFSQLFTSYKISLLKMDMTKNASSNTEVNVQLNVPNKNVLIDLMKDIKKLQDVVDVYRL